MSNWAGNKNMPATETVGGCLEMQRRRTSEAVATYDTFRNNNSLSNVYNRALYMAITCTKK